MLKELRHYDYTVGWICALPMEMAAATSMLDEIHAELSQPPTDHNSYTLGEVGGHPTVIACLPVGIYGTTSAATVVSQMRTTFPAVQYGVMVGIGGGVPNQDVDIRLGDIVISKPTGLCPGVIQYDYGKTIRAGKFEPTGFLNQPPQILLTAVAKLHSQAMVSGDQGVSHVVQIALARNPGMRSNFSRPNAEEDRLFQAAYEHPATNNDCGNCDIQQIIDRPSRSLNDPHVHYGPIASGNQVMKHGCTRDSLAERYGILCFEMEAAGIMNLLPCLVIRGICDYCDSHKNNNWQGYAALAAAAYAKMVLSTVPSYSSARNNIPSPSAYWTVPFERNMRFLGRHDEISGLEERILNGVTQKTAIAGLGGVGKTQIALELAYRVREKDSARSVFWIPSTSREAVEQAFVAISDQVGIRNVSPVDAKSSVKAYLTSEHASPWLLIIDNADDMDMWISTQDSLPGLKAFLPSHKQGFILFTTRNQQLATKLVGPDILRVQEFGSEMAMSLLINSLIDKELIKDRESSALLLDQLGGLPLAIMQAAGYINENSVSISTYVSLLNSQESEVIELLSQDFEDPWRYTETHNQVAVTWLASFRQIQETNPLAIRYLSLMACVDHKNVPRNFLFQTVSQIEQHKALGVLKGYAFVTEDASHNSLRLHRLVHLATRNWLKCQGTLGEYTDMAVKMLLKMFRQVGEDGYTARREYLPHGLFILKSEDIQKGTVELTMLAAVVGKHLCLNARPFEAGELLATALDRFTRIAGADYHVKIAILDWMAIAYFNQGRNAEAENMMVEVLSYRIRSAGSEDPDTLLRMDNLAQIYATQGRWAEAEKLHLDIIGVRQRVNGWDDAYTLEAMHHLAVTYYHQQQLEKAEELYQHILSIEQSKQGTGHPSTLHTFRKLASVHNRKGQKEKAQNMLHRTLDAAKKILPPDYPLIILTTTDLAWTYATLQRWENTKVLLSQAMEVAQRELGPEHVTTSIVTIHLAAAHRCGGEKGEGSSLELEASESLNRLTGLTSPETFFVLGEVARLLASNGQLEEAEELQLCALDTRIRLLGQDNVITQSIMRDLLNTYMVREKWVDLENLGMRFLDIRRQIFRTKDRGTLSVMRQVAIAIYSQGRNGEAISLLRECVRLLIELVGEADDDTSSARECLGMWEALYGVLSD